ncbi:MAG: hypothetical protein QM751_15545 [Paludibacteraceae bacterium]
MKRIIYVLILLLACSTVKSQSYPSGSISDYVPETAVSGGFGMGGSSVFGGNLELMFLPKISAQLGAGIDGFSGAINYHFYPTVSSPFLSLQVWQSGTGNRYKASYVGPIFQYRANRLFQAGIGLGRLIDKKKDYEPKSNFVLSLNLGLYFQL